VKLVFEFDGPAESRAFFAVLDAEEMGVYQAHRVVDVTTESAETAAQVRRVAAAHHGTEHR